MLKKIIEKIMKFFQTSTEIEKIDQNWKKIIRDRKSFFDGVEKIPGKRVEVIGEPQPVVKPRSLEELQHFRKMKNFKKKY